ncbi:MAG: 5-(carboxyamino)imidazole ribonucleotide mutase [Candidatus Omnitrophica bacterium]|nr:5-(carboxyamino)imidazole ribonucleotide mutase [Candidatus Omnitrophota bacterium]
MKNFSARKPLVGIIMGSGSDQPVMEDARRVLKALAIPFEMKVVSAHRTPDWMFEYAQTAKSRGIEVIIAGAGGAAHLPGMTASITLLPVIGVPVETRALKGLDSLLSIAQMPSGIPVACMAVGNSKNAGLLAARILANKYPSIYRKLEDLKNRTAKEIRKIKLR